MAVLFLFAQPAFAACNNPSAAAGVILYNSDSSVPQYCDDTDWVRMAPPPREQVTDGLIGHWKLDETGGTTANDATGVNNGTMQGGLSGASHSVAGTVDTALDFDGTNHYISVANESNFDFERTDPFTLSAWIYRDNNATEDDVFGKNISSSSYRGYSLFFIGGSDQVTFNFNNHNTNNRIDVSTTANLAAGSWQHVVLTYDGSSTAAGVKIYFNGVSQTLSVGGDNLSSTTLNDNPLIIGSDDNGAAAGRFDGKIDDARVYNRELTADEVQQLYALGGGVGDLTSNLVGHWKLDEITYTSAADSSGNNHHGSLLGGLDPTTDSVAGPIDTALRFAGGTERVEITGFPHIPSAITIQAWLYIEKDPADLSDMEAIFYKGNSNSATGDSFYGWRLRRESSGNISFSISDGAVNSSVRIQAADVPINEFFHVVGTWADDGNMAIYFNGELDEAITNAVTSINNTGEIGMGGARDGSRRMFTGRIDDARVYDRVFTADDVKALYLNSAKYCRNPDGVPGQLYYNADSHVPMYCDGEKWVAMGQDNLTKQLGAYWKFEEASGATTAIDSSGNGNDGTYGLAGANYERAGMDGYAIKPMDNEEVEVPHDNSYGNADQLTVTAWVREPAGGSSCLVEKQGDFQIYSGSLNKRVIFKAYRWDTNGTWRTGDNALPVGWNFLAVTYDYGSLANDPKVYVNGVNVPITNELNTPAGNLNQSSSPLYIGNREPALQLSNTDWNNPIDELRIYKRILSLDEINALYQRGLADDGLVAYWPLNEAAGSAAATDMAGDNIGYVSGGVIFGSAGQIGLAAEFDGVDGRIDVDEFDITTGKMTILAWIKPDSFNTVDPRVIAKSSSSVDSNWSLQFATGAGAEPIRTRIITTGAAQNDVSTGTVSPGVWTHVGYTYDPAVTNEISFYINGSFDSATDHADGGPLSSDPNISVTIGNQPAAVGDRPFDGLIDDLRIYNRVLSAAEISEIYAAGAAGKAAEDCTNPSAAEGVMLYNTDDNVVQYCDGTQWVQLGNK